MTAAEPPQWSDPADAKADAGTSPAAAAPPSNNPFANFTIMDWVQLIPDVVGFIPIAGEVADFINAIISLVRGDLVGAGLSVAAMWPAGGQGVTIAKIGVKYGDEVAAVIKNLDEAVAGVRKGGDEVADGANTAKRIPCVTGAMPVGRVPGLAAPLKGPCEDILKEFKVDPTTLESAPGSTSGKVTRPQGGKSPLHEVQDADTVATAEGRDIVLVSRIDRRDTPGIDGVFSDGQLVQLKRVTGKPSSLVSRAKDAYRNAKNATADLKGRGINVDVQDVDVHIRAEHLSEADILKEWKTSIDRPSPSELADGTLRRIVVYTKDGIIELPFNP